MNLVNETVEKVYGHYPEKVLQFGEGNFLRAFVDWMIDKANAAGVYRGSIVLCQPIPQGLSDIINAQEGVYTLAMRGFEDGTAMEKVEKITSVSRCINPYKNYQALLDLAKSPDLEAVVSNTTEAGISYHDGDKLTDAPPHSFPAKVTAFLYTRYCAFQGALDKGLLFLPVELIDNNGAELKKLVLRYANEWHLEPEFINWINTANEFTNTLVDRIVTGYPKDQIDYFEEKLGYRDPILVTSELFHLWVIEGNKAWADKLPLHKTDANIIWTENVAPYKKRKVRILNGAHTSTVLAAYLSGHDIVLDFMNDDIFSGFLNKIIYEEVLPTLDLPKAELQEFASAVSDRFSNPYIKHKLLDISLNSCSKFHARCLPTLLDYAAKNHTLPKGLAFSLAAFIRFYKGTFVGDCFIGTREDGSTYQIKDDLEVLSFFSDCWKEHNEEQAAHDILSHTAFWGGKNLSLVPGLESLVAEYLIKMESTDIRSLISSLL